MIPEMNLLPPEPRRRGVCAWCGEEIEAGELVFVGDEGRIHSDCILPLLTECLGPEYLASLCGYQEEIA